MENKQMANPIQRPRLSEPLEVTIIGSVMSFVTLPRRDTLTVTPMAIASSLPLNQFVMNMFVDTFKLSPPMPNTARPMSAMG